jgi:hypothetical protein
MKKCTHTHTYLKIFFFTLVLWELSLVHVDEQIGSCGSSTKKHIFFSFLLRPHKILLSLSFSLSVFYYRVTKRSTRTQPRARKRRGTRKKRASRVYCSLCFFIARVLLVLYMPRYRMYFFYRKTKTKASLREKRKKEGE